MSFNSQVIDFLEDFKEVEQVSANRFSTLYPALLDFEIYEIGEKMYEVEENFNSEEGIERTQVEQDIPYWENFQQEILKKGEEVANKWTQESDEFNKLLPNASQIPSHIYKSYSGVDVYVTKFNDQNGFLLADERRMYFAPFGSSELINLNDKKVVDEEEKYKIFQNLFSSAEEFDKFKQNIKRANEFINFLNTYQQRKVERINRVREQGEDILLAFANDRGENYKDMIPDIEKYTESRWMDDYRGVTSDYNVAETDYSNPLSGFILDDKFNENRNLDRYYLSGIITSQRDALVDFIKQTVKDEKIQEEIEKREKLIDLIMQDKVKINVDHIPEVIKIDRETPSQSLKEVENYANSIIDQLNKQANTNVPQAKVSFSSEGQWGASTISGVYRSNLLKGGEKIEIFVNPDLGVVNKDALLAVVAHEYGHALHQKEIIYGMIARFSNIDDYICEAKKGSACDVNDLKELSKEEKVRKYFDEMLNTAYSIANEEYADIIAKKISGLTSYERAMKTQCRHSVYKEFGELSEEKKQELIESLSSCSFVGLRKETVEHLINFAKLGTSESFGRLQDVAGKLEIKIDNDLVFSSNLDLDTNVSNAQEEQSSIRLSRSRLR